jgi:hypothetical protein
MDFPTDWNRHDPNQFNPMYACKHPRPTIAILEAIESLREFVVGSRPMYQISNDDFAAILRVAATSIEGIDA